MKTRRWKLLGFAVAASLAFATAACGTANDEPGTTTWPNPASPRSALLAAVAHLKTTTFKVTAKFAAGATGEAVVDPVAKVGTQKMSIAVPGTGASVVADLLVIGGESYAKTEFRNFPKAPKLPTGWMKLDTSKLDKPQDYTLDDPDPASLAAELFKGLGTVEQTGDGQFTGTLDLTKGTESGLVDDRTVENLKDKAKEVPFEAAVDDQGRIASFRILVPANGAAAAETWEIGYSDWGVPVTVEKPASATPAPATAYEFFNA
jgi:hypothetical protein